MINIVNLQKSFQDIHVLKGISLSIEDHQIYGIIGQSGAGKSTLLRCVNGLESYDGGEITVDGTKVDVKDKASLRNLQKRMGMIFQNFNLLERLDVFDNIALPMKFWGISPRSPENKKKILDLIHLVGLDDKVHARPRELSGGQKRRVAIAGVIAMRPEVLILDEPTAGLDPVGSRRIMDNIRAYRDKTGSTVMIVSHDMDAAAKYCDRIIVFDHGSVKMDGTPEVFTRSAELTEIGLDVPKSTELADALRRQGIALEGPVFTHAQLLAALQKAAEVLTC